MPRLGLLARFALAALGALLLVGLVRGYGLDTLAKALHRLDIGLLVLSATAGLGVYSVHAWRWRGVLAELRPEPPPPFGTFLGARLAAHATSFLLPSAHLAGEPVRAGLVGRAIGDAGLAALSVVADRAVESAVGVVAASIYVAAFVGAYHLPVDAWWTIAAGLGVAAIGLGALYVLARRRTQWLSGLAKGPLLAPHRGRLADLEARFAAFLGRPAFARSLVLAALAEALVVVELSLLFRAFGLALELPATLGVLVGMGVASLVPIPAGLGSIEAMQIGVTSLADGPASLGLAIGLLVRWRETLWAVAGLVALSLARPRRAGDPLSGSSPGSRARRRSSPRPSPAGASGPSPRASSRRASSS